MRVLLAPSVQTRRWIGMAGVGLWLSLSAANAEAQLYQADPEADAPASARMASSETTIMLDPLYLARIITADDLYSIPLDGPAGGMRLANPEYLLSYSVARITPEGSLTSECVSPVQVEQAFAAKPSAAGAGEDR